MGTLIFIVTVDPAISNFSEETTNLCNRTRYGCKCLFKFYYRLYFGNAASPNQTFNLPIVKGGPLENGEGGGNIVVWDFFHRPGCAIFFSVRKVLHDFFSPGREGLDMFC